MDNSKQLLLAEFRTFITKQNRTVDEFIRDYINYHGDLNRGHQNAFVEHLKTLLGEAGVTLTRLDILDERAELKPAFLQAFSPVNAGQYYQPAKLSAESIEILADSENEWQSTRLPSPMNMRLHRKRRPAVKIFKTSGQNIFIGPFGYQLFDPKAGTFAPEASSRAFPRTIESYPTAPVQMPVVIIKDRYDGTNFAHYLYDYIPRIIYFAQTFPDLAASSLYIMGGVPGPFQHDILHNLSRVLNIPPVRFIFPQERYILQAAGPIFYFSDQMELPTHPLNMCHPKTMQAVDKLFTNPPYSSFQPPLIYVSRRDARLRKIVNEDQLAHTLGRLGYIDICLSNFTVAEQRALFQTAESVVAPHGMGLTHLFFANPRCRVLELFHPVVGTDAYAFVAAARGMRYDFLVGTEAQDGKSGYRIEIDAVVEAIKTQAST